MRLSAECVRSDTSAPSIHTRRSPRRTPAFSAAPPLMRFTENRPLSPAWHNGEEILFYCPSFVTLDLKPLVMPLPSSGVKLMPNPETGSLVMWHSLGGLQPLPLIILVIPRGFWPRDTAFSYTSPSTTNKLTWFPLSFIFRATWWRRKISFEFGFAFCKALWSGSQLCFYLRVWKIINKTIIDLQQSISISEATLFSYPARHYFSDNMARMPLFYPQMKAVCLSLFSFKNTEVRVDCWHKVWACRNAQNQSRVKNKWAANLFNK